jgi:hypothetical protein
MGCWHETCGLTGLAIVYPEPVRIMAIKLTPQKESGNSSLYRAFDLFQPITILTKGKYNDYGWVDFDEGEEERFFNSALSIGVGLVKEEDDNPEFPPNYFQWMIREDAFQMLKDMPIDSWGADMPTTVGQSIAMKRDKFHALDSEIAIHIGAENEENQHHIWTLREEMGRIFNTGEMPIWPLKNQLNPMLGRRDMSDAQREQNLEDLLNLWQVFMGMNALRKALMPTPGAGSQDFNENGYTMLGKFMVEAIVKEKAKYDEEN